MKTLLQKAKDTPVVRGQLVITPEHEDVAIAWLKGVISSTQISRALGRDPATGNVLYMLARALKSAYEKGRIIES